MLVVEGVVVLVLVLDLEGGGDDGEGRMQFHQSDI